jgi:hypothetical protein
MSRIARQVLALALTAVLTIGGVAGGLWLAITVTELLPSYEYDAALLIVIGLVGTL